MSDSVDLSDPRVVASLRNATFTNPDSGLAQLYCQNFPSDDEACWGNDVNNFYMYRVSLGANAAFLALFGLSLLGFLGVLLGSICVKRWRGTAVFNASLAVGVLLEMLGYVGRVMSWQNQWKEDPFLMQITALTLGPAFLAASLYLCLRRIVQAFGRDNSRIKPEFYTRIFIPCDVLSLILQGAGGGLAAASLHGGKSIEIGNNIMIAGLIFQCVTLGVFILVSADFAIRVYRRQRALGGASALDQNPTLVKLRSSLRFRAFLVAVALATVLILWRSIFRAAELQEGWSGPIMANQPLFIAFEGVLVLVAVLALNVAHPAWCATELFQSVGSTKRDKKSKNRVDAESGVTKEDGNITTATASESQLEMHNYDRRA